MRDRKVAHANTLVVYDPNFAVKRFHLEYRNKPGHGRDLRRCNLLRQAQHDDDVRACWRPRPQIREIQISGHDRSALTFAD